MIKLLDLINEASHVHSVLPPVVLSIKNETKQYHIEKDAFLFSYYRNKFLSLLNLLKTDVLSESFETVVGKIST